jgi:membrane protease YdiL (CAAX protease family)
MATPEADSNWRAAHGGLFLLVLGVSTLIPAVRQWPLHLLAPLLAYLLLALAIPPLRRTLVWLKVGRLDGLTILCVFLVGVIAALALAVFQSAVNPDVRQLREGAPPWAFQHPVAFLILFSIVNALLEELLFRGILFDSLASQIGLFWTLLIQAAVFGYGHMLGGYPPGVLGAVLAGIFGLLQGLLRLHSGGLAAPWLSHIVADAVIVGLVFRPE